MYSKIKELADKYTLSIVVFITGFAVMLIEITGSRILSPFIGTSIIAWTSLIGVVLACLSVGYYLGGKVADKYPKHSILSLILVLAAVYLFTMGIFDIPILTYFRWNIEDVRILSAISSLTLFGIPTVLLGMVSPYSVKLSLKSVNKTGRITGNLYAISTAGSIVGTFVTGLYLISVLGSSKLILIGALLLLFSALLLLLKTDVTHRIFVFLLILLVLIGGYVVKTTIPGLGLYDKDSQYNRIIVDEKKIGDDDRSALILMNGKYLGSFSQSGVYTDDKDELIPGYTRYFRLINHFIDGPENVLMLGGGGYTYARDFLRNNPESTIDVVEIDPEITNVAKEYFGLEDDPRLTIYHEDGRVFLNRSNNKYDAIILDIYSGDSSVPFHLTTQEAIEGMKDLLRDDGFLLTNVISAVEGDKGKFLQAEYKTIQKYFEQVYIIPLKEDASKPQNIVLIATNQDAPLSFKSANTEYNEYLAQVYLGEISTDIPILTDDYAPVEYYLYERLK